MKALYLILLLGFVSQSTAAKNIALPEDPTQSITYWKAFSINAEQDNFVAVAESVFDHLLRAWDKSRVEPSLFVVKSDVGPWAASLSDGNILLSRKAIETCMQFGEKRGENLLAFVLAHELAHQKADDLWHQKFFRLAGSQAPEARRQMLKGLKIDQTKVNNLERQEAQADNDGLVLMATVGFDPFAIVDKKDFFTTWVEQLWRGSCSATGARHIDNSACEKAHSRAIRARAQLGKIAVQTTLFDLGNQAFISGHYSEARRYFTAFGREFPSRAVHTNIGLTHLMQAQRIRRELIQSGLPGMEYHFPLMLETSASAAPSEQNEIKTRGLSAVLAHRKKLQGRLEKSLAQAKDSFEKVVRLDPAYKPGYFLLAATYLASGNTFMARGMVQGQYQQKFGNDLASQFYTALATASESKDIIKVGKTFDDLIAALEQSKLTESVYPKALLLFSVFKNYSNYLLAINDKPKATSIWKRLAAIAEKQGDDFLLNIARNHQNKPVRQSEGNHISIAVNSAALGHKTDRVSDESLWIEGEQLTVHRFKNGAVWVVDPKSNIIAAWQDGGSNKSIMGLTVGENASRPVAVLGLPTRHFHTLRGEYLAYDQHGIAIRIVNNKIAGWFLYSS